MPITSAYYTHSVLNLMFFLTCFTEIFTFTFESSFVKTSNSISNVFRSNLIILYDFYVARSTSKSKALSYLRDAPADPSIAVTLEGELHLKITFIDSKRSPDRSWRTVTAEIRGTKLKMTIHREGKSNHVSTIFCLFIFKN